MKFQRAANRRASATARQTADVAPLWPSPAPFKASPATLPRFSIGTLPILPTGLPVQGVAQLANGDDEDDGRSLKELQADLERLSRKPRREKIVSEQKPPRKKDRRKGDPELNRLKDELASLSQKPRREKIVSEQKPPRKKDRPKKVPEKGWKSLQPVIGHEPVPLEKPEPQHVRAVRAIKKAIEDVSESRSSDKIEATAKVYRKRSAFPKDADRKAIRKLPGGTKFLDSLFGESGSYVPSLKSADMTSAKVLDKANEKLAKWRGPKDAPTRLKAHNVANTGETRITHRGVRLYTLHRGSTAFKSLGRARDSGREVLSKKGSSKEYVRDDRGVPTRRFAYAIKGERQVEHIAKGGTLRGRFTLPTHPVFGRSPRTIMSGSHTEIAELGRVPPRAVRSGDGDLRNRFGELTSDEMLYMHQEFGSGDRQRGVSISSSPTPLLSNEARGFADKPGAKKLRIDLSTVARSGRRRAPNLINFYQRIRGMKHKRVVAPALYETTGVPERATPESYDEAALSGSIRPAYPPRIKYGQKRQQRRFDWSVTKNRELFLASLGKRNLKGSVPVSRLERTDIPKSGIEDELERVKEEAREGEEAIPRIRMKKQKGKTRQPRKGPKGRNT